MTQNPSPKGPAICSMCLSSARPSSLLRFSQEESTALAWGSVPAQGQMEDAHSLGKSHSKTTVLSKSLCSPCLNIPGAVFWILNALLRPRSWHGGCLFLGYGVGTIFPGDGHRAKQSLEAQEEGHDFQALPLKWRIKHEPFFPSVTS